MATYEIGHLKRDHGEGAVHLANIMRKACKEDFVDCPIDEHGVNDMPGILHSDGHGLNFVVCVDGEYKRVIITSA